MTYKQLADLLGVKKDKIRYLAEQLPADAVKKIDGVMHLSNHAVDAVVNAINGGQLESGVDLPPYDPGDPVGWDWNDIPANFRDSAHGIPHEQTASTEFRSDFRTVNCTADSCETADFRSSAEKSATESVKNGDDPAIPRDIPHEQTANCENDSETAESAPNREIVEYYQKAFLTFTDLYDRQLKYKDEQIKQLTEQVGILASAIADRDSLHDSASSEQLRSKDTQIERMQDTIDALTRQLEEAERERREAEQSREAPRKWWQWWKR